jgi:ribonuclease E
VDAREDSRNKQQRKRRDGQKQKPEVVEDTLDQQTTDRDTAEGKDKPRKRPSDMKRGEPQRRRRSRGRKPSEQAGADVQSLAHKPREQAPQTGKQVAEPTAAPEVAEPVAPAAEDSRDEFATPASPVASEIPVPEAAPAAETSMAGAEAVEDLVGEEPPGEAPRAEAEVAETEAARPAVTAPMDAVDEQPALTTGLTGDGRAVNDPRVAPRPVGEVAITTQHPVLFTGNVAPPVTGSGRIAPRASNDPRGPLPHSEMPQAAAQS